MRLLPLLVLLAFALACLPPGKAHIDTFSEAKTLNIGPYSVFADPRPAPLYAGTTLSFSAIITDKRTGYFARDIEVNVTVTAPNGNERTAPLRLDPSGYHVGAVLVTERGNHTGLITIREGDDVHQGEMWFDVYPDLPVRFTAADPEMDQYVGTPTTMRFEVYDPQTQGPAALSDLTMQVEHWSDDHSTMLGAQEVPLEKGKGLIWQGPVTFPEQGMYHLRFASQSGGFTYDDVPLLHMTAIQAPADTGKNETPLPGLATGLAVLALAALARARK